MALIGNYTLQNRTPARQIGSGVLQMTAQQYSPVASWKNRLSAYGQVSGTPYGYLAPISWVLPNAPGAMRLIASAVSVGSASGAGGRAIEASGSATSIGEVLAGAIVPIVASSAATSSGSATASGAANIEASGSGVSSGSALVGGVINILDVTGAASSSGACNLTALGFIVASGGGPEALSPQGLANAVWDTIIADHATPGTTGKALADAGGAGNPWSAATATNNDPGTFGERVQKLLTTTQFRSEKD